MKKISLKQLLLSITLIASLCTAYAQTETTTTVITTPSTTVTTTPTTVTTPVVEERRIVTTVPEAKELIEAPAGYVNCFYVKEGWYANTWVPEHRVCQYQNSPQGIVWVQGYWACDKYNLDNGECTNWIWRSPRWATEFQAY